MVDYLRSDVIHVLAWILTIVDPDAAAAQREITDNLVAQFERSSYCFMQLSLGHQIADRGDRGVLSRLEPFLRHPDRCQRANAAVVFAKLGDERGLRVLIEILDDYSWRPKGQRWDGGRWTLSGQILEDRRYATALLGQARNRRAVAVLESLRYDPDLGDVAEYALRQMGGEPGGTR